MTNSRGTYYSKREKEGFYNMAKKQGFRARSYFKLEQIDVKYNIIKDNLLIIDLGCAPGGWLEYVDNKVRNGKIVGIDLLEVKKQKEFSKNVQIIEDDFNNITDYKLGDFDLVLSDMAPEFCGDSVVDRGRTHKLNLKTLEFCRDHLKFGGNLVFKSFEGDDLESVRNAARKMFQEVKEYKPKSSDKKSAEVFEICLFRVN